MAVLTVGHHTPWAFPVAASVRPDLLSMAAWSSMVSTSLTCKFPLELGDSHRPSEVSSGNIHCDLVRTSGMSPLHDILALLFSQIHVKRRCRSSRATTVATFNFSQGAQRRCYRLGCMLLVICTAPEFNLEYRHVSSSQSTSPQRYHSHVALCSGSVNDPEASGASTRTEVSSAISGDPATYCAIYAIMMSLCAWGTDSNFFTTWRSSVSSRVPD
ncbi:hypothetical protein PAXRUDRAFT_825172 [Paxillus rubicundulus Ve08.2h10]|uniref:Uncharacterized protein n=1 Tax=Paxillus rubicundulus Ve08.2h10 TaxID=930991 RepID=A0A0D0DTI0_9AGAM|nr:hypothetical protein PAXRUDRAFT_825172 [Paxillus rubicundulus Ve08.2h10]